MAGKDLHQCGDATIQADSKVKRVQPTVSQATTFKG